MTVEKHIMAMEVHLRRLGPHSKIRILKRDRQCFYKVWVCGRGTGCEIYAKSKYASRRHFAITYKHYEYFITDLNSSNGTLVNNHKLRDEQMLTFGTTICVGVPYEFFNIPDCFVYVFEPSGMHIGLDIPLNLIDNERRLFEEETRLVTKFKKESETIKKCMSIVRKQLRNRERWKKSDLKKALVKCLKSHIAMKVNSPIKIKTSASQILVKSAEDAAKTVTYEKVPKEEVVESPPKRKKPMCDSEGPTPAKMQKLEHSEEFPKLAKPPCGVAKPTPVKVESVDHSENFPDVAKSPIKVESIEHSEDSPSLEKSLYGMTKPTLVKMESVERSEDYPDLAKSPCGMTKPTLVKVESVERSERNVAERTPPSVQKLGDSEEFLLKVLEKEKPGTVHENLETVVDEDQALYEAPTQYEKVQSFPKEIPGAINYSQTEELIEIDDTEDVDWDQNWKPKEVQLDSSDDDDDVLFLRMIIKPPKETVVPSNFEIGEDFTATDRKWLEKLMKVKQENESCDKLKAPQAVTDIEEENINLVTEPEPAPTEPLDKNEPENKEEMQTSRKTVDVVNVAETLCAMGISTPAEKPAEEKKKKNVRFNLEPEVRYFDVEVFGPKGWRDVQRGRQQFLRVVYNICNWNTHWLKECVKMPPDVHPSGVSDHQRTKIKNSYFHHSQYMFSFIPNMLFEIWEKVREKRMNNANFFRQFVSFDGGVDFPSESLCLCNFTGLAQSIEGHRPLVREGHLVLLRVHQDPRISTRVSNKYSKKFGYLIFGIIERKTYEKFNSQKLHPIFAEKTGNHIGEDIYLVKLEIFVKMRHNFKIDRGKLVQLTVLHQLSPALRSFRGICYLPHSPICKDLLKLTNFQLPERPSWKIVFKEPLSSIQEDIVLRLSQACLSRDRLVYSIHGAAGTGKSHVVIALIWQLLLSPDWKGERPKIIYCTIDGPPLDEMVSKLKNSISARGSTINLVRASYRNPVLPDIQDLCIFDQSLKPEYQNFTDCEGEVLRRADIICTSCTSGVMTKMISVFGGQRSNYPVQKIVCIIDEAVSTRETDCVVPLLLRVTHLILVGDPYQMQPSTTRLTKTSRVAIPLFLRIYDYFKNDPEEKRPYFTLKTQYRINPSLSQFLIQQVYTDPFIVPESSGRAKFRNYLLLVDMFEPIDRIHQEKHENLLVQKLVREIFIIGGVLRYAVITCSENQSQNLQEKIKSKFPEVEVNKVQAFHGRQFDVVFFLYDGSEIHPSVVATAITRAKTSLFIVSLRQSLNVNPWFQVLFSDAKERNYLKYVDPYIRSDECSQIFANNLE